MVRRVVSLWGVLGCFGIGAALDAAAFRLEACCKDLRLGGLPVALLRVVGRLSVAETLIFSTGLYFRESNACEGRMSGPVNAPACCAKHSHKHSRTLGLRLHNCSAFCRAEYMSRAMFIAFAKIDQSLL